jgi:hypothetical protein
MAYGTNGPFGLRALYNNTGSTWVERRTVYSIPNTGGNAPVGYDVSLFNGDLVRLSTLAAAGADGGVNTINVYLPAFTQNVAGTANTFAQTFPVLGVFQDCEYYDVNNQLVRSPFWPANTLIYPGTSITAYVNDDPNVVWEVQASTYINAAAADFTGAGVAGLTSAPFFPGTSATAAKTSGIGSNFSIMGGGGINFNTIPIDPANPTGAKYTNNPVSTMTAAADGTAVTVFGTNPYGGDVKSGLSGAYLCVSTYGKNATNTFTGDGSFNAGNDYDHTVVTLPLKAIGYSTKNIIRPGKTLQTTPFLTLLVTINNHVFKAGTPGQTFA